MSSVLPWLLALLKCRLGMGYKENSQDLREKQSLNSLSLCALWCWIPGGGWWSVPVIAVPYEKQVAGFWDSSTQPCHVLKDPVICTNVLFPRFLISQENCGFLFEGVIHQVLSLSHLTATVSSPWATLATHLSVNPWQFLQMCLEKKQFVWERLGFLASKKRLIIFLPKQAPGGC